MTFIRKITLLLASLLVISLIPKASAQQCACTLAEVAVNSVTPCDLIIGTIDTVSTVDEFYAALVKANDNNGNSTILIADGDYALVKAWKGDRFGNLVFKGTARNFNPVMAMAGKITIAEVEELVEPGELDPNFIHLPGVFVQHIFQGVNYEKRIEQRTVREPKFLS